MKSKVQSLKSKVGELAVVQGGIKPRAGPRTVPVRSAQEQAKSRGTPERPGAVGAAANRDGSRSVAPGAALAVVALGSNLGDSRQNVLRGINRLVELSERPLLRSSLWQTTPVDCPPDSPVFVNAVVGLVSGTDETPETLLAKLHALEKDFGRRPKEVLNEPRPLDLDLIAFGNETRATQELTLPHPRAHERRFVLQPLREIAPDLILPGQSRSVMELLHRLPPDERMRRLENARQRS